MKWYDKLIMRVIGGPNWRDPVSSTTVLTVGDKVRDKHNGDLGIVTRIWEADEDGPLSRENHGGISVLIKKHGDKKIKRWVDVGEEEDYVYFEWWKTLDLLWTERDCIMTDMEINEDLLKFIKGDK